MATVSELRDVIPEAFATAITHASEGRVKFSMIGADEVPEQVNLAPGELCGDFDAGNYFELFGCCLANLRHGGQCVVIGDGYRGESGLLCERGDLCRRELAIAPGGVKMQVSASGSGECRKLTTN